MAYGFDNSNDPDGFFGNQDGSVPGSFAFGSGDDGDWGSRSGSFAFGSGGDEDDWASPSFGNKGSAGDFQPYGMTFGTRPNRNSPSYPKKQPEPGREGILLIAESKTFMVNAITKSLEDEFYAVTFSRPAPMYIDSLPDRPKLILMYVDGTSQATTATLTYLNEICQEDGDPVSIYLVGTEKEIADASSYLPQEHIRGTFSRPLNVKLLVEKLRMNQALAVDNTSRRKILVVDDDPVMLRTIKTWLSNTYQVFMASSGANAIALLARNHVDLVLLDYEMPVISGAKVFEMMRSEPQTRDIPVMFLTARDDRETVMKVSALRPERYILKGTPPDEVIRIIDEFFTRQN